MLDGLPAQAIEKVELTAEARTLSEQYIAAGVIGPRMAADAQHIAIATTSGVDVLELELQAHRQLAARSRV